MITPQSDDPIQNNEDFHRLVENRYEGIMLLDADLNIVYKSLSAQRITGWKNVGRDKISIEEIIHPDERKAIKTLLAEIKLHPALSSAIKFRAKHFDGHYIWIQCFFTNSFKYPETGGAIVCNFRDVTEEVELQKQHELLVKKLEDRNAFIETILQNIPLGISVNRIDDGKATVINKQFSEIYGWDEADLTDVEGFFAKVYPDEQYRNEIKARVLTDINSGDPARMNWKDIKVVAKNGEKRIVNAKNIPVFDQNLMISTVIDVTSQYEQAVEIKHTKANQEALINSISDLIWSVDTNLNIIAANKAYAEMTKIATQKPVKEGDPVLVAEFGDELNSKWKKYYERALNGERYTVKERVFDPVKQQMIYGQISFNPMYNNEGEVCGVACYSKDVTEDTMNVLKLENTRAELQKIMDSSLDMICSVDANGCILKVSAACKAILGYDPDELVGKALFDYLYAEDLDRTMRMAANVQKGNNITYYENRYVRKDGSIVPLFWSARWDVNEQIRYGVARDATEQKKNEAALIESEKKYKSLFENNPLPIFIWDFETLQIVDCNQEAVIKYGYSREEFLKLTIKDIRPEEDIPLIEDAVRSTDIYCKIHKRIWRHKKKNGEIMFMDITGHLLNINGRVVSLALSNEVTESLYYTELDKIEKNVLELNTRGNKALNEILDIYLSDIEKLHPGMFCTMQELKGSALYNLAAPSMPTEFLKKIEGLEIGLNAGSCGTAAFLKQKVIVTDIQNDARWEKYKTIALDYDLKACWSYPILDEKNNVMATFACYYHENKSPSELEENTAYRASYILQIVLDGYQRKNALKISNERFEYVTEATSDVIWDWNLETNTVYYSSNIKKLFGHTPGYNNNNLPFYYANVHPDDRERVVLYPDQVKYGTMLHWTQEYRFQKADGEYAFVLDKGLVIRDKNGVGVRMVGAMQDISKQKEEEARLKLLESVVTNSTDAVVITEAEPYDEPGPRILYVNEAFTKMSGYTFDEVIGKTPRILQGPKSDRTELNRLKEAIVKWQPCEISTLNYKKNGDEFWINFSVNPVADKNGLHTHWVAIERDITQRLNYIKAIEEQNENLKEIAWLQSHVIRAPLARMMGLIDLLQSSKIDESEKMKSMEYLLISANELDNVIRNITDMTQKQVVKG